MQDITFKVWCCQRGHKGHVSMEISELPICNYLGNSNTCPLTPHYAGWINSAVLVQKVATRSILQDVTYPLVCNGAQISLCKTQWHLIASFRTGIALYSVYVQCNGAPNLAEATVSVISLNDIIVKRQKWVNKWETFKTIIWFLITSLFFQLNFTDTINNTPLSLYSYSSVHLPSKPWYSQWKKENGGKRRETCEY